MNKIILIPNNILKKKCYPIEKVTESEITFSKKMIKIMNQAFGVGLAAPQLGILKRIITINVNEVPQKNNKNNSYALFNPKITWFSKNKIIMEEGCLSIPKQFSEIQRPKDICIEYLNNESKLIKREVSGYESRTIQHEIDHLDGKLFIDYLSSLKRNMIIKRVQKLKKIGEI